MFSLFEIFIVIEPSIFIFTSVYYVLYATESIIARNNDKKSLSYSEQIFTNI